MKGTTIQQLYARYTEETCNDHRRYMQAAGKCANSRLWVRGISKRKPLTANQKRVLDMFWRDHSARMQRLQREANEVL